MVAIRTTKPHSASPANHPSKGRLPDVPPMQPKYDNLFRKLVSDPLRANDVLKSHLPPCLTSQFAGSSIPEAIDGNIVSQDGLRVECDALFRLNLATGDEILVLVEHKARPDPNVALQLLRYRVAIWSDDSFVPASNSRLLPPVVPVVFYHGRREWTAPRSVAESIAQMAGLEGLSVDAGYLLVDLSRIDPAALAEDVQVRAALLVLVLADVPGEEVTDSQLDLLVAGFAGVGFGEYIARSAADMLDVEPKRIEDAELRIRPGKDRIMPTIAQQYEARGEARGEMKGRANTLLRQISLKFGEVPEERRRQVTSAGRAELDAWIDSVLTARDIDDVFSNGTDG